MTTQLTLMALRRAIHERHPCAGLIHHSDRGMQYASSDYIAQLKQIGAQVSMSSVSNSYENAKAESFFKTLKQEEVYLKQYQSFEEAEANIDVFLEQVYNCKRLHSSLGYVPPAEFEARYVSRIHDDEGGIHAVRTAFGQA
jgi:putative transposase